MTPLVYLSHELQDKFKERFIDAIYTFIITFEERSNKKSDTKDMYRN